MSKYGCLDLLCAACRGALGERVEWSRVEQSSLPCMHTYIYIHIHIYGFLMLAVGVVQGCMCGLIWVFGGCRMGARFAVVAVGLQARTYGGHAGSLLGLSWLR